MRPSWGRRGGAEGFFKDSEFSTNINSWEFTSYLRDAKDFLSKVRKLDTLPAEAILVSLVNLYPSIPHEEGLSALSHFLKLQGMPDTALRDITLFSWHVLFS
jgi:hypothetical protein